MARGRWTWARALVAGVAAACTAPSRLPASVAGPASLGDSDKDSDSQGDGAAEPARRPGGVTSRRAHATASVLAGVALVGFLAVLGGWGRRRRGPAGATPSGDEAQGAPVEAQELRQYHGSALDVDYTPPTPAEAAPAGVDQRPLAPPRDLGHDGDDGAVKSASPQRSWRAEEGP